MRRCRYSCETQEEAERREVQLKRQMFSKMAEEKLAFLKKAFVKTGKAPFSWLGSQEEVQTSDGPFAAVSKPKLASISQNFPTTTKSKQWQNAPSIQHMKVQM